MDGLENHVGYIAEQEMDIGESDVIPRRWFRTRRGFMAHVFDRDRNEVLRVHMPSFEIRIHTYIGMEMDTNAVQ